MSTIVDTSSGVIDELTGYRLANAIEDCDIDRSPMVSFFRDLTKQVSPMSGFDQLSRLQNLVGEALGMLKASGSRHVEVHGGLSSFREQTVVDLAASAVQSGLLKTIPRGLFVEAFSPSSTHLLITPSRSDEADQSISKKKSPAP